MVIFHDSLYGWHDADTAFIVMKAIMVTGGRRSLHSWTYNSGQQMSFQHPPDISQLWNVIKTKSCPTRNSTSVPMTPSFPIILPAVTLHHSLLFPPLNFPSVRLCWKRSGFSWVSTPCLNHLIPTYILLHHLREHLDISRTELLSFISTGAISFAMN